MRRLPVINSAAPEDDAAASRPTWQWILIGAGFTAVFWIPMALLSLALLGMGRVVALLLLVEYACAAAGAGAVMGQFATRVRARDAAMAAALAAGLLTALAATSARPWLSLLTFAALGPAGAAAAYATSRRFAARRS